jgi:hypothetical protein
MIAMVTPLLVMLLALALALLAAFDASPHTNAVDNWLEAFQLILIAGLFWCLPAFVVGALAGCLLSLGPYLWARKRTVPLFSAWGPTLTLTWLSLLAGSISGSVGLLFGVMLFKVG